MKRRDFLGAMGALSVGALIRPAASQQISDNWAEIEKNAALEGEATMYHTFSPTAMPDRIAWRSPWATPSFTGLTETVLSGLTV